jgi:hypothetical protein
MQIAFFFYHFYNVEYIVGVDKDTKGKSSFDKSVKCPHRYGSAIGGRNGVEKRS